MGTHERPRRSRPSVEGLEGRFLLTYTSNYYATQAANVRHEFDHFVTEVQGIELQSHATPAQYLALRDDARTITEAAAGSSLAPKAAYARSLAVSVQIDRSILYGSLSDQAWGQEASRLKTSLAGLNVPQTLVDRTIADEKVVATSAAVSSDQYQTFNDDFNRLRADEKRVPAGYGHFRDPGLFYTQHLRGFFRGWAVNKTADEAALAAELKSFPSATVARDAQILENLGTPIPSRENDPIHDAFVAAFAQGVPSASQAAALRSEIVGHLGSTATPARLAAVDRLIADAQAFYTGVGSSMANVRAIADDVRTVVNDGAGSTLDPFKVTIGSATTGGLKG